MKINFIRNSRKWNKATYHFSLSVCPPNLKVSLSGDLDFTDVTEFSFMLIYKIPVDVCMEIFIKFLQI